MSLGPTPMLPTGRRRGFLSNPQRVGLHGGATPGLPAVRPPRPWYRRWRVYILGIAVVVGAAFLTDHYDNYSTPQRSAALVSFYQALRTDLTTCNDGVSLTITRWHAEQTGGQGAPTADGVAALAKQAEANCTPVSPDTYNLESAQVPGALSSYHQMTLAAYQLGQWAYPNAASALLAIETLVTDPTNAGARAKLAAATHGMDDAVTSAQNIFDTLATTLGTRITPLHLARA